jgi:hypothetical protein
VLLTVGLKAIAGLVIIALRRVLVQAFFMDGALTGNLVLLFSI